MKPNKQEWFRMKVRLEQEFGSVRAAARHFNCTTEALRHLKRCPRLGEKVAQHYRFATVQALIAAPVTVG